MVSRSCGRSSEKVSGKEIDVKFSFQMRQLQRELSTKEKDEGNDIHTNKGVITYRIVQRQMGDI